LRRINNNNKRVILLGLGCTSDNQIIKIIKLNTPALCGLFIACYLVFVHVHLLLAKTADSRTLIDRNGNMRKFMEIF